MKEQRKQECFAIEELQQLLTQSPDNLIIIDVRNPDEYAGNHIPDAINIPLIELERRTKEFKKDALILTVCGKGGGRSAQGAELLRRIGFINSTFLCGGTFEWFEKIMK